MRFGKQQTTGLAEVTYTRHPMKVCALIGPWVLIALRAARCMALGGLLSNGAEDGY
jgi:hypothetical protein